MPDLEELLKAIVPLTFLAFWALSSLFGREPAKAPPARPVAGFGPRPGVPPGSRPVNQPGAIPRDPSARWGAPGTAEMPGTKRPQSNDEILIIRSETSRTPAPPPARPSGGTPVRRSARAKAPSPAPAKRPEPAPTRPLNSASGLTMSQQVTKSMEVGPLTSLTPGLTELGPGVSNSSLPPKPASESPFFDPRRLIGSPEKLREAFLLNIVLQPPAALRHRRPHP
jgi:hypothetical protein